MRDGTRDARAQGVRAPSSRIQEKREDPGMKWFIDSMLGYWIMLLAASLGAAACIYVFWLKDALY